MAKGRKTGGRVKGVPNKINAEIGVRCRAWIEDPAYQEYFHHRLMVGQIAPQLEAMMWHYGYGKPLERQELSGPNGGPIPVSVHDHFALPAPQ